MEIGEKKDETHTHLERVVETKDIAALAEEILTMVCSRSYGGACVVALNGPLGAGKTTFVQACAHILGVKEVVTSPTFVVQKRYRTADERFSSLVHIDAYRIEDIQELIVLCFNEVLKEQHTLILIEWSERILSLLPRGRYEVTFEYLSDLSRRVEGSFV